MSRPTKYKEEYDEQAKKLCRLGATDKELADFFDIAESTLNLWKERHPSFMESLKLGKTLSNANVADSLYNRAIGYVAPHDDIRVVNDEIVITRITKFYPPDPVSCIYWLKNRERDRWKDKWETEEDRGTKVNVNIIPPEGYKFKHPATKEQDIDLDRDEQYTDGD